MRTVLLWILGILLGIVLLALVIVLVLLNIRAGIEAVGVTGEVSVEARYGPVRIPVSYTHLCYTDSRNTTAGKQEV